MRHLSVRTLLFSAAVLCALCSCVEGSYCTVKVKPYLSSTQSDVVVDHSDWTYTLTKARSVHSYTNVLVRGCSIFYALSETDTQK